MSAVQLSPLKTLWEKEKLLVMSNFSFSHSKFYPIGELSAIFIKLRIDICKHFQFGKSLKFVVWERVKLMVTNLKRYQLFSWNEKVLQDSNDISAVIVEQDQIVHNYVQADLAAKSP